MNNVTSALLALFAASSLSAQDASQGKWYDDYDLAVEAAKREKKDLLVDFTGSDWCGWCIRLHKEVFDHAAFDAGVKDHFILVALDFPRGEEAKAKVPNAARNSELQMKYSVQGFPTILLMDAAGEVYGKTGYQAGGPEKYVESLDKMRTVGKKKLAAIKALVAQFESGEGEDRDKAAAMAVDLLATMAADQMGLDKLAPIALTAVDSKDAALSEKAVTALLKSGVANDACIEKAIALDPKNNRGLLELTVQAKMTQVRDDASAKAFIVALENLVAFPATDKELFEGLLFNATRWSDGPLKNPENAVKFGKLLKANAKDPKVHAELLEKVLKDEN